MRKAAVSLVVAVAGLVLVAATAHAQATMTIRLSPKYLFTGTTRVIEVVDLNCNDSKQIPITGGEPAVTVPICKSDAGYGNIRYRNVTNNGPWINSSLLSDGDEVSP